MISILTIAYLPFVRLRNQSSASDDRPFSMDEPTSVQAVTPYVVSSTFILTEVHVAGGPDGIRRRIKPHDHHDLISMAFFLNRHARRNPRFEMHPVGLTKKKQLSSGELSESDD